MESNIAHPTPPNKNPCRSSDQAEVPETPIGLLSARTRRVTASLGATMRRICINCIISRWVCVPTLPLSPPIPTVFSKDGVIPDYDRTR